MCISSSGLADCREVGVPVSGPARRAGGRRVRPYRRLAYPEEVTGNRSPRSRRSRTPKVGVAAEGESPYPYEAPVSQALFDRASAVTPGGVNSPVRAFRAVGGTPRFMVSGTGPYLTDADGREYVDLVCSWGPMILGHSHPEVIAAVQDAVVARHLLRYAR